MRQLPIGVLFSLALHALVVLGVSRFSLHTSQPVVSAPSTVVWLATPSLLAAPEPAAAASEPVVPKDAPAEDALEPPRESEGPATPTDQSAPTDAAETVSPEPTTSGPRPSVDLTEARQRAVDTVLKDRELASSYFSFTFPGTIGEQRDFYEAERHRRAEAGLQAPLTAFDSPSKGRAGLDEKTVLGQYVRWVSDECYQTFGTSNPFVLPIVQGLYAAPTTHCVGVSPRDDLFATAKPAYLMDAEGREAADERLQRMERLRRPTTGAVMQLEE